MKMAIPFFLGGGGGEREGGVKGSQNLGKSSASFKRSTTKDSQKLMIMQSSQGFWIRPCSPIYISCPWSDLG